jgi:hypothetical protein
MRDDKLYVSDTDGIHEISPWGHKEERVVPRLPVSKTLAGYNVYEMD